MPTPDFYAALATIDPMRAAQALTWLAYAVLTVWIVKTVLVALVVELQDRARSRRFELFALWCTRRAVGTWWERENATRHWLRILREGPNSACRGPWEDDDDR